MSPTMTAPRADRPHRPGPAAAPRAADDSAAATAGLDWRQQLRAVELAADLSSARIAGHELTAESPRQLQSQLAIALYDHLHAGRGPQDDHRPRRPRDRGLEARFAAAVPAAHCVVEARIVRGPHTVPTGTVPTGTVPTGSARDQPDTPRDAVVEYAGSRLRVPVASLAAPAGHDGIRWQTGAAVRLRIAARRPALSPGFYLVDGTRPIPLNTRHLLRLYVHLQSADAGVDALAAVLRHLHRADVPHRVKVLSAAPLYPRRDALVVYLPPDSWASVPGLVDRLAGLPGRGDSTSAFARRLAPGVAAALEPRDAGRAHAALSFGQHRGVVCATALVESRSHGTDLDAELDRQFRSANINPADPARNLDSPALPPTG